MRIAIALLPAILLLTLTSSCRPQKDTGMPLRLHPDNPHYFLYQDKPTILITSAEHYGAVLNLDFDYIKYLNTLQKDGMNLTRIFSGAYVEPAGAFRIERNTLAPVPGRFIAPWARSTTPGYANGGNKFDLSQWSEDYFNRLKDFVAQAHTRDIIVEVTLFCPFYGEEQWSLSPMNIENNINNVGDLDRMDVYTLDRNGGLLAVQETLVRKIVEELNAFENIYFEICNEPYFGGVTLDWQRHIVDIIIGEEFNLPAKHLISRNVANAGPDDIARGEGQVEDVHPSVSILNFHYANPPVVVGMNYHFDRVIGENETGFRGTADTYYRREAWEFILAGGALFNHLDYSFAAGYEDGTFTYPETQPGGGSAALRKQLKVLSTFIHGFDFVKMNPDTSVLRAGIPDGVRAYVLAKPGNQYALYLRNGQQTDLELEVPDGSYGATWIDPVTGETTKEDTISASDGTAQLSSPAYNGEIALRLERVD